MIDTSPTLIGPIWEPAAKRPPSLVPTAAALIITFIVIGTGLFVLQRALSVKYLPRANVCAAVDISAIVTLVGVKNPSIKPSIITGECDYETGDFATGRVGSGSMDPKYHDSAVEAQFAWSTASDAGTGKLPGFGDQGRVVPWGPLSSSCGYQATVLDSNLVLTMTFLATQPICSTPDAMFAALSTSVHGTLTALS